MAMLDAMHSVAARTYARVVRPDRFSLVTFHRFGRSFGMDHGDVRRHLEFMQRNFDLILPRDLTDRIAAGSRRIGMVTVDDCHRDTYEYLYAAAKEMNVPIMVAVPTDYFFRHQWLWFDHLYWMLERAPRGAQIRLDDLVAHVGSKSEVEQLKQRLKACLKPERDELLSRISTQLGVTPPGRPSDGYESIAPEQMREMLDSGLVEISAHAVTHTIATVLPGDAFLAELVHSKRELEEFAGLEIPSFCYPNGLRGDFSDLTTELIRQAGFKLAFTSVPGDNPVDGDIYRIRRIHAHPRTGVFEREVSGLGRLQRTLLGRRDAEEQ